MSDALIRSIQRSLKAAAYHQELLSIMEYAVFPAGKLFRPKLVEALASDLSGKLSEDHCTLAAALEIHHAYTLVHDDLPAMDNDLMRRGKPSTHAAFGEWKAILTGDALLIASFATLHQIKSPQAFEIFKFFSWATGAKGLVSGQFLDLAAQGKVSMAEVLRIHELKTARLIQVATVGTYLLSGEKNLRGLVDFLRLGREIGLSFQLLDDLNELAEPIVSDHEKEINPFLLNPTLALHELKTSHQRLKQLLNKRHLNQLSKMLLEYFESNRKNMESKLYNLKQHLPENCREDLLVWTTSLSSL
jgi:geranylgeranyl pyrophosphate synthase